MMLVVLVRDRILMDSQHPVWKHYEPFKWWLLPHGITAALALLLGPLQFSSRLRRRHLNWHRISGRLYVAGVAIGVPLGIVIETIKYRIGVAPLRLLIGTMDFGSIFMITTGMGFALATTWPDRGASAMDDAQLRGCHGLRGGSLRGLSSSGWDA